MNAPDGALTVTGSRGNYIFNLETTKIELHFDKSDYDTLTDEQRRE